MYNLKANHLMGGANLYVARELNRWFYLDLQGTVGVAKNKNRIAGNDRKHDLLYMGGLGMQFRFTPLFESQWVEPYLRVGVNYLHKNFASAYGGNLWTTPWERRTGNRPMCGIPMGAHRIRILLFRFRSVQV